MQVRGVLLAALAMLALALSASEAKAQMGMGWCGGGNGGFSPNMFLGYASNHYSMGHIPYPPYFALHPPVYYSYPVSRTYGLSPFASPPPAAEAMITPALIENPHLAPEAPAGNEAADEEAAEQIKFRKDRTAQVRQPQMIVNPYVAQDRQLHTSVLR